MDKEKKIEIAKMILAVVGTAGLLSVALVAPNAVRMFGIFTDKKPYQFNFRFNKSLKKLEGRGLVKISGGKVELTEEGKKELVLYELKKKLIKSSKKWDGKWRIVAFDIWERRRGVRNAARNILRQLGFIHLQNSVWIFPYECQDVIELLKTYYKLRPAVFYIVAESIGDDDFLKEKFDLK